MLVSCGDDGESDAGPPVEDILHAALDELGAFEPINLDTASIARAAQNGEVVHLPFALREGGLLQRDLRLALRNLRAAGLGEIVLKDGVRNQGRTLPLPPPATYQGVIEARAGEGRGAAVLTITPQVVEGNLLVAPDGWSIIEPLEPLLRLRGVDAAQRQRVLRKYNHIAYNAGATLPAALAATGEARTQRNSANANQVESPAPLVLSMVADGDAELLAAYPADSVMPYWLKQETLLNAVDWLYNCIEPDANADNDYTECSNFFDGGSNLFQARVRIDGLEVWTAGGPDSLDRDDLLRQSAQLTHQASPVCCGEPHTAGRSNLVYFFSGKVLANGSGVASVNGLNVYGDSCFAGKGTYCCHHAVSQVVPGGPNHFPGTLFHQQLLMAHEIGHINGGAEQLFPTYQTWLRGTQTGTTLMYSGFGGFTAQSVLLYSTVDAGEVIGPLLYSRLGAAPQPAVCSGMPIGSQP